MTTWEQVVDLGLPTDDMCFWCNGWVQFGGQTDHVVPRVVGGPDMHWNLVFSCQPCNAAKGSIRPISFARKLRTHLQRMDSKYGMREGVNGKSVIFNSTVWSVPQQVERFVAQRELFAIETEGRFRSWAAQSRDPRALKWIRFWDQKGCADSRGFSGVDDRLVGEIQSLRAELAYYRDLTHQLHNQIAELHAEAEVG